jgi:hypothetical protein
VSVSGFFIGWLRIELCRLGAHWGHNLPTFFEK